jgi:hypothetical protein
MVYPKKKSIRKSRRRTSPVKKSTRKSRRKTSPVKKSTRKSRRKTSPVKKSRRRTSLVKKSSSSKFGFGAIEISTLDEVVANILWETSRIYDTLDKSEKKFADDLTIKYQIYVITEAGYKRDDKMSRVSLLSSKIGLRIPPKMSPLNIHDFIEQSINEDLRKISSNNNSTKEKTYNPSKISVKFGMGEQELQEQTEEKKERKELFGERKEKQELFGERKEKPMSKEDQIINLISMLQDKLDAQEANFSAKLAAIEHNTINGTNTQLDGTQLVETYNANKKQTEAIMRLEEHLVGKDHITEVKWSDIPTWVRLQFSKGLKRLAISTVTLPFKCAKSVFVNWVYMPLVITMNWYTTKLQFLLGHIYWILIIGGVIVLVKNGEGSLSEIYNKFGGPVIYRVAIQPTVDFLSTSISYFPGVIECFMAVYALLMEDLIIPIAYLLMNSGIYLKDLTYYALKLFTHETSGGWLSKAPDIPQFQPSQELLESFIYIVVNMTKSMNENS